MLLAEPLRMAQAGFGWVRRAAHYALRRSRAVRTRVVAWAILRRYTRHYRRAAVVYREQHHLNGALPHDRVYSIGVEVVTQSESPIGLQLPPTYSTLVSSVARRAADALERSSNCSFFPAVPPGALLERTMDVPAVVNGDVISIKLKDPLAIEGMRELCEPILEQLERHVYGSHVIADKIYVYRSPVSRQRPAASWLWHFDNHPREMLKVMIYLTDVTEDTAPFEYLRDRATGRPQLGSPLAPLHGDSRVSAESIASRLASGCDRQPITGPQGTLMVFDDNVIHRGTMARTAHRDVVVFQVRPALFNAEPRLDPRWTGTFGHRDFNLDPHAVAPEPPAGRLA